MRTQWRRSVVMSWLLARYLSTAILKYFVLFTLVVLVLASVIQFLENRDGLLNQSDLSFADIAVFSILSAPETFSLLAGFIALVSGFFALIAMMRFSELKAMLAAGLTYAQAMSALAPAALVMAGFHFWVENSALPHAAAELRHWHVARQPGETSSIWVHQGNQILVVDQLLGQDQALQEVEIFVLNEAGHMVEHIAGPAARFSASALLFPKAVHTETASLNATVERDLEVATTLNFPVLSALGVHPRKSSAAGLTRVLDQSSAAAHPYHVYVLWLHKRLSAPATTLCIVLLLALLVQPAHRISSRFRLLLIGLGAGFLCFVLDAVLAGMGEAAVISPILAAWGIPCGLLMIITGALFVPKFRGP